MPYIHHRLNGASVGCLELGERPLTIGRGPDNDLVLDDGTVSQCHAVIESDGAGGDRVRDLDSTNGVFVNGERVEQARLAAGDTLRIGLHDLQYLERMSEQLQQTLRIRKSWIPGVYYTTER